MIFVRLFIDKIPDTWNPFDILFLIWTETAIEMLLLGILVYFVRTWIGI